MSYRIYRATTVLLLTALVTPALLGYPAALLNVELSRPKAPVSPTSYGLMTEEINDSDDGVLYAELVRNRTFRSDWSGTLNWFLVENGTSAAKVSIDSKEGPSAALSGQRETRVPVHIRATDPFPIGL